MISRPTTEQILLERRHQLFDDQLAACHALRTGGPVDVDSATVRFEGIHSLPRPVSDAGVPSWIGGKLTERNLVRIVRWGSGWIPAPGDGPAEIAGGVRRLDPTRAPAFLEELAAAHSASA